MKFKEYLILEKDKKYNRENEAGKKSSNVSDVVQTEINKLPEEKQALFKKLLDIINKTASDFATSKAGDFLNELLLGNFNDAVIGVLEEKMGDELDNEAEVEKNKNKS